DRVLDLGTGSGCILLSLLAETPDATGLGVDLSPAALRVAQANADALGLTRRAALRVSDWLAQVSGRFDLIVANPPYVTAAEFDTLDPEPRLWEPRAALTPGGDGLDAYRVIARDVVPFLRPGGRLLLEIGPAQGAAVCDLLERAGLRGARVAQDLDGRDRVVHLRR
ncbi:N5-glutamine methyltransferase family protein, partial [Brevirhabdus sp.]|uniref:N5-glutamine methyltransferase family protein n=1 Tax=Brevirhabdus sp. TaxID=2004514 RepID=UPI0040596C22